MNKFEKRVSIPFKREGSFGQTDNEEVPPSFLVSIPFKREGSFGRTKKSMHYTIARRCFHSLQTGRLIRTRWTAVRWKPDGKVFSIPFKREGSFGRVQQVCASSSFFIVFQFPSNGKAHSDNVEEFEFFVCYYRFQFPSNGKAHSDDFDVEDVSGNDRPLVSIPFKREGSFGRSCYRHGLQRKKFPFPSNGKAHSDQLPLPAAGAFKHSFQFPSNGKAHSDALVAIFSILAIEFQFPSNGKAHSDLGE